LRWLVLAMVLVGAFNAVARYTDATTGWALSSNTWLELQWYAFALVFLLGAPYALATDDHVRVDVLYGRLGPRAKAGIDLAGTLLLLVPFCLFVLWFSLPAVQSSWAVWEQSPNPGGLPRYPIKTAIPVACVLLLGQGAALALRCLAVLRGADPVAAGRARAPAPANVPRDLVRAAGQGASGAPVAASETVPSPRR
jgi:TRAP-type mannitol/chloroaromatic compound transport system permease small subunit